MTRRTSPADTRPLFSIETESVSHSAADFETDLRTFRWAGKPTVVGSAVATMEDGRAVEVPTFTNEFWTSRQRVANNLHEISYRACFKPQLPRFFIERLTRPCDPVYGPFMGRGTTLLEAAIDGRVTIGCDANPLSAVLLAPRLAPPTLAEVTERLDAIPLDRAGNVAKDLLVFYHPNTLGEICALRAYLLDRERAASLDGTVGDIGPHAVSSISLQATSGPFSDHRPGRAAKNGSLTRTLTQGTAGTAPSCASGAMSQPADTRCRQPTRTLQLGRLGRLGRRSQQTES